MSGVRTNFVHGLTALQREVHHIEGVLYTEAVKYHSPDKTSHSLTTTQTAPVRINRNFVLHAGFHSFETLFHYTTTIFNNLINTKSW